MYCFKQKSYINMHYNHCCINFQVTKSKSYDSAETNIIIIFIFICPRPNWAKNTKTITTNMHVDLEDAQS